MFKKVLSLGIILSVAILACACTSKEKGIGSGKNMVLAFDSNPTTGFDWILTTLEGTDVGEIEVVGNDYTSENKEGLVGGGGIRKFVIAGKKPGKQALTFTYKRNWEGGETAYDVVYEIEIDDNLNVFCNTKMKGLVESDKDLSFFPDPTFE